jgi:AAA15 family ATPase/GTPase
MIDGIHIENFKSIDNLSFELGRVNVFIGANGSGKSNLLEAIAFGAAAANDKLDNEFLASRGIRVTDPRLMRSAFEQKTLAEGIRFKIQHGDKSIGYFLENKNENYSKWNYKFDDRYKFDFKDYIDEVFETKLPEGIGRRIDIKEHLATTNKTLQKKIFPINPNYLSNFLIYSPENNKLRKFEEEAQIEPLGIYGEGLFRLLSNMEAEEIEEIRENLPLIDWFEDFQVPGKEQLHPFQRKISIRDRFIAESIDYFDQRSTNEGFLYLLFYLALVISTYTPKFFAIDNIDNSLNPKLCIEITKRMARLSKKYDKQVILTTHNPAVLDGINLKDEEQRLFVVYRNIEGRTRLKRIDASNFDIGSNIRLSEAFIRGYIGGLNRTEI